MKNILMICPFTRPNLGGVESHLDKLLDYLKEKKVFVYLLTYQPLSSRIKGEKLERGENFEIRRFSWFGVGWFNKLENYFLPVLIYLFPGLFLASLIFYLKHRKEVSCIHAHGLASAAIVKILSAIFPKRTVVSTHAVYGFARRKILARLTKWLLSSFDEILAVSEVSKKELIDIGLNKEKINVHKNWIDLRVFFSRGRDKCKKELKLRKKAVLFVGRMIKIKGIDFLLSAAEKFPEIDFVFIGDGPMRSTVENIAGRLKNILYVGRLSQSNKNELEKLIKYYSAADFFATIPTYNEGFGAVYLETISCGTPVLASNLGSLPTFLDKTVSLLVNPSQNEVNCAIGKLFRKDDELLKTIQKNCRVYAEKNFSNDNAQVILKSYHLI